MPQKWRDKHKSKRKMSRPSERLKEILLIDDNRADTRLTIEALKDSFAGYRVTVIEDGEKTPDLLRHGGRYAATSRPDLILLDLNLPKIHGHEVLAALKADPTLHSIPVIVLTTSLAKEDKRRSYTLGAEYFMVKPSTWDGYQYVVETIDRALHAHWPLAHKLWRRPDRQRTKGNSQHHR
jgi:CheY-like chemotaxis protein